MQRSEAVKARTGSRDLAPNLQAMPSYRALAPNNSLAELARSSSLPKTSKSKAVSDKMQHGTPREKSPEVVPPVRCPSLSSSKAPDSPKALSMTEFMKCHSEEEDASEECIRSLVDQIARECMNPFNELLQSCATRISLVETCQAQLGRDLCLSIEQVENAIQNKFFEQATHIQDVERSVQDVAAFCQAERALRESAIAGHDSQILEVRHLVEQGADSALRTLDERLRIVAARLEDATPALARPMKPIDEEANVLSEELSSQVASLRAAMDEASKRTAEIERRCGILEAAFGAGASEAEGSTVSALVSDVKLLSAQLADHLQTNVQIDELETRLRGSLEQVTAELSSQRVDFHRDLADLEARIVDAVRASLLQDVNGAEQIYDSLPTEGHFVAQDTFVGCSKERREPESKSKARMVSMLGNGSASTKAPSADELWHEEDDPPVLMRTPGARSSPLLPGVQAARQSPTRSLSSSSILVLQGMRESNSARSLSLRMAQGKREPPTVVHSARRDGSRHTMPISGVPALRSPASPSSVSSPRTMWRCGVAQPQQFQHVRRIAAMPSSPPLPTR